MTRHRWRQWALVGLAVAAFVAACMIAYLIDGGRGHPEVLLLGTLIGGHRV